MQQSEPVRSLFRSSVAACAWLARRGLCGDGVPGGVEGGSGTFPTAQRLLVVSQVARADPSWAPTFEKYLLAELSKTRVPCCSNRNPLALHDDKARYAAQIAEFMPDLVLVVEPGMEPLTNWQEHDAPVWRPECSGITQNKISAN